MDLEVKTRSLTTDRHTAGVIVEEQTLAGEVAMLKFN